MAIGTTAALIMGGASLAGSLIQKNALSKAQSQLNNLQYQPIDLEKLKLDAQANAEQNLAKSIALEQKYQPHVAAARLGLQTQLAQDIERGGKLPLDVANQVTKASMGAAGAGGFGAGPLTAAQLGLSSLQLRNQAQERANAYLAANPMPISGLDPGALASATIGQNQAMNQFNLGKAGAQANLTQSQGNVMSSMLGNLGGMAALGFSGASTPNIAGYGNLQSAGIFGSPSSASNLLGSGGGNITFGTGVPTLKP